MKKILLLLVVMLSGVLTLLAATTYYVATNGLDSRTGTGDWTNAVATISNAVFMARTSAGNLILVSNGLYTVSTVVAITNGTTIRSWNNGAVDPTNTIVNGNGLTRCLNIQHSDAVVGVFQLCTRGGEVGLGFHPVPVPEVVALDFLFVAVTLLLVSNLPAACL